MAPRRPRATLQSLPPILRILGLESMPSCSKASRGLFVLLRVGRIFTATSISPSPSLRQRPSRYAFHAGRNLPDKGFRYLRTVIVTAAVHRGFGSKLAPLPLTFRHWARVSPYTSAFALAETCVFGKQSPGPITCGSTALQRRTPSRGRAPLLPKLRGHFAEFLNEGSLAHLVRFADCLPVSVCGTGANRPSSEDFLDSVGSTELPLANQKLTPRLSSNGRRGFACGDLAYAWGRAMSNRRAPPTLLCPP